MTRVVAGTAGGRTLVVPRGGATRPTSERVREALFSRLEHEGLLDGTAVLDLYAGSGALGIEAASRGASTVVLVEAARAAAAACRRNVASTGLGGVLVREERVERVLAGGPDRRYDLVLLDPPYDLEGEVLDAALTALVDGGWLAEGGHLVVERSTRATPPRWPPGTEAGGSRRYGETVLWAADAVARPHPPQA